jgi:hypothetical protein
MIKRALCAVAGFLSLSLSLAAQQIDRADVFIALNNSALRFPSLTLSDAQLFSFAEPVASPLLFNWMETQPDVFLLPIIVTQPRRVAAVSAAPREDSSKEAVDVRQPSFLDNAHGEIGFIYGRSSGKFGRDFEASYIIGEVGDDKFHISAGASYENSTRRR